MRQALPDTEEVYLDQPPGVVTAKIDPTTGEAARPGQRNAMFEFFYRENAPKVERATNQPAPEEDINPFDLF